MMSSSFRTAPASRLGKRQRGSANDAPYKCQRLEENIFANTRENVVALHSAQSPTHLEQVTQRQTQSRNYLDAPGQKDNDNNQGIMYHLPENVLEAQINGTLPEPHKRRSYHPSGYPLTPKRLAFHSAEWLSGTPQVLNLARPRALGIKVTPWIAYVPRFYLYRPQTILSLRSLGPRERAEAYEIFFALATIMLEAGPMSPQYDTAFMEMYDRSWGLSMGEAQYYDQFRGERFGSLAELMDVWNDEVARQAIETPWLNDEPTPRLQRAQSLSESPSVTASCAETPGTTNDGDGPGTPQYIAEPRGTKRKEPTCKDTEEDGVKKKLRVERIETNEARWNDLEEQIKPWWYATHPGENASWYVKLNAWDKIQDGETRKLVRYTVSKDRIDKRFKNKVKNGELQPGEWKIRLEMWEEAMAKNQSKRKAATTSSPPAKEPIDMAQEVDTQLHGPKLPPATAKMDSVAEIEYSRYQMAQKVRDAWEHPKDTHEGRKEKPDYSTDTTIESSRIARNGRYTCGHTEHRGNKCCDEGLSRAAKIKSIRKSMTLFRLKMERLTEAAKLHPAHKTWAGWFDEKIAAKTGGSARRRTQIDAILTDVKADPKQVAPALTELARKRVKENEQKPDYLNNDVSAAPPVSASQFPQRHHNHTGPIPSQSAQDLAQSSGHQVTQPVTEVAQKQSLAENRNDDREAPLLLSTGQSTISTNALGTASAAKTNTSPLFDQDVTSQQTTVVKEVDLETMPVDNKEDDRLESLFCDDEEDAVIRVANPSIVSVVPAMAMVVALPVEADFVDRDAPNKTCTPTIDETRLAVDAMIRNFRSHHNKKPPPLPRDPDFEHAIQTFEKWADPDHIILLEKCKYLDD